jgi:hypothetical protein
VGLEERYWGAKGLIFALFAPFFRIARKSDKALATSELPCGATLVGYASGKFRDKFRIAKINRPNLFSPCISAKRPKIKQFGRLISATRELRSTRIFPTPFPNLELLLALITRISVLA